MKKHTVNFKNQNVSVVAEEGVTLANISNEAGFPLDLVCGGKGTCGKCRVEAEINNDKTSVLACQFKINSDINVYLSEEDYRKRAQILECSFDSGYTFNPCLQKIYKDNKTIRAERAEGFLKNCHIDVLRNFSCLVNMCEGITFIIYNNEVIDVQPGDTTNYLYGAAVDIGTTTVVMYIYDLNTGELINTFSDLNNQLSAGADVISRINYADNKENLDELNGKIILTLNNMVQRAEFEIPNLKENLYNIILCGNSTMQHLFLGLRPDSLGVSPFTCITKELVELSGNDINLQCPDRCKIVFLPLLGGFVGADTTALLLTIADDDKDRLIIDLGTNGEIAANNKSHYYVASTACGPALEGGCIECGMRGTDGAIEKVKIENNDVVIKVIGDTKPLGICGSGIIDAVSELLRNNIIDKDGRMLSKDEYEQLKPYSRLKDRFVEIDGINSFILHEENKIVYISQKDIRQVQLAKSSIYSGCMAIMNAMGKDFEDIDEIVVAGAFGNYIDANNAVYLGLLPNFIDKIKFIGNGAGKGVSFFLLDSSMNERCKKVTMNTTHYELASDEYFTSAYMNNINFTF